MKSSHYSAKNSQFHSVTSKSSNSSITSILREPSPDRPKKKNSVRFDDSPTVSVYSDSSKFFNSVYESPTSPNGPKSSSPVIYKPLSPSPSKLVPGKKSGMLTTNKYSPVKITVNPEPKPESIEKKVTPTVISYSFRTQGFYDKLNKFYSGEPGSAKAQPERIYIKLNTSVVTEKEKVKDDKPVINLRPCSSNMYHSRERIKSPIKDSKTLKRLRGTGQNILN